MGAAQQSMHGGKAATEDVWVVPRAEESRCAGRARAWASRSRRVWCVWIVRKGEQELVAGGRLAAGRPVEWPVAVEELGGLAAASRPGSSHDLQRMRADGPLRTGAA